MTYILYNPLANCGDGMKDMDKVQSAMGTERPGQEIKLVDVTREPAAAVLMGMGAEDAAVICGGDGTLHHLINDLNGAVPTAPVYVWRMGTGNDFLRDVLGASKAERVQLNEYIKALPCGEVNGQRIRFLNNLSFGLDGQVCEQGELERERLGRRVNYIGRALRMVLGDYKPIKATVTVDGESRTYERVWVASAMNGRYFGGGFKIAPGQDRNSDKLCVVVLHNLNRVQALLNLARVYWGGHVKMRQCDVRFGHEVSVTCDRPTALNMDGEVFNRATGYGAEK